MRNGDLTYDDYLRRLNIQDVLIDAGYRLNRRDGLRYPSYVRTDSDGRRIRGDKFIVTPNGQCCFQPPDVYKRQGKACTKQKGMKTASYQETIA